MLEWFNKMCTDVTKIRLDLVRCMDWLEISDAPSNFLMPICTCIHGLAIRNSCKTRVATTEAASFVEAGSAVPDRV